MAPTGKEDRLASVRNPSISPEVQNSHYSSSVSTNAPYTTCHTLHVCSGRFHKGTKMCEIFWQTNNINTSLSASTRKQAL